MRASRWRRYVYFALVNVMGNRYGAGNPAYDGLNRLTQFGGAPIQHDLLGNRLQDARYLYQLVHFASHSIQRRGR